MHWRRSQALCSSGHRSFQQVGSVCNVVLNQSSIASGSEMCIRDRNQSSIASGAYLALSSCRTAVGVLAAVGCCFVLADTCSAYHVLLLMLLLTRIVPAPCHPSCSRRCACSEAPAARAHHLQEQAVRV